MIPEEYKYETDYRKIPSEYLNKSIPQGRGMVSYYHNKKLATINYWNNGYITELVGYILNINTIDQYISVKNNLNITCTIAFSKLYNIN